MAGQSAGLSAACSAAGHRRECADRPPRRIDLRGGRDGPRLPVRARRVAGFARDRNRRAWNRLHSDGEMTMVETQTRSLGPNQRFVGVKGGRASLSTPALLLDLDALERNIAAMAAFTKAAGINLRPHSKGAKSIGIARRQIAAGAIGICCSTLGEAEVIAGSGIEGVLITSPVVTPAMIEIG